MIWENYGKKNYFTSYQTILGNPVSMIRENYGKKNFYPVSYENLRAPLKTALASWAPSINIIIIIIIIIIIRI